MTARKNHIRSYSIIDFNFSAIRIIDKDLIPVEFKLSVSFMPSQKKRVSYTTMIETAEKAYQRINYWVENHLVDVIIVHSENSTGLSIAATSNNLMMISPYEPYDETVAELFHSKLSSLSNGDLLIGEIRLSSSDNNSTAVYECTDKLYRLPTKVSEYLKAPTYHSVPWWARNDGYSFEFIKTDNISFDDYFAEIIDPLDSFESVINDTGEEHLAPVIKGEKWKPLKI